MPPKNEHKLKEKVDELLKERTGLWFLKVHGGGPFQRAGIPDYLICYLGQFIALELKHPDGTEGPTPRQEFELRQIANADGMTLVATSVDEVEDFLNTVRRRMTE